VLLNTGKSFAREEFRTGLSSHILSANKSEVRNNGLQVQACRVMCELSLNLLK
jgi:hypothetical protein